MSVVIVLHALTATTLLVVGLLALRAPKRRQSPHPFLGEVYFWLLAVALPLGMVVGARHSAISAFEVATPPTFAFGLLGYVMVKRRPRRWLGQPWLVWHIAGQGGSYIGVVTATGFQVVPRLVPDSALVLSLIWMVPTIVGSTLIARTIVRRVGASAAVEPA